MPRYAVLSDIHGNLEAFEAVLGFCEGAHIDKYILLGDVVGYNADPVRCVGIARSLDLAGAVRGNGMLRCVAFYPQIGDKLL